MIISRQHLDIDSKPVFERLQVKAPHRYAAVFPDEACFLHFRGGALQLSQALGSSAHPPSESLLLSCGNYVADLLRNREDGVMDIVAIHLHPGLLRTIFQHEKLPLREAGGKGPQVSAVENTHALDGFVDSLFHYFEHPQLASDPLVLLKLKEFVHLLLQTSFAGSLQRLFDQLFSPQQMQLEEIVEAHIFSSLSVPELATLAGQSLSAFKRSFEALYHESPAMYIRNRKLEEAARLLQQSAMPVAHIAWETGFADLSNFSKAFRRHTGMSPKAFRQQAILSAPGPI